MSHETAEKTSAVERYLLGESTLEERVAFEAHFFNCDVCAAHVSTGSMFVDNYRAVMREDEERASFPERAPNRMRWTWFQWLRPASLVPSFAALALSAVVGYQNLVTLPALLQPQVLSELTIAPQARGNGDVVRIDRRRPMFNVNFDVNSPHAYPRFECTFAKRNGKVVRVVDTGLQKKQSFRLGLMLETSNFSDGSYTMTLRPSSDKTVTIGPYLFNVQTGEPE